MWELSLIRFFKQMIRLDSVLSAQGQEMDLMFSK